jgi:hypothetical protein
MNQKKFFTYLILALSIGLMSMASYSEDNDDGRAGHNGSPGEMTCAKSTCHTSFTLNSGPGSVSINAVGMTNWQYVPGQTYTIQVTVAQTNFGLFGFGFEALLGSGANAGTLTPGIDNHALNATVLGNSRKTITHDLDDGLSANSHTFTFTWLAPATAVPVTFYAAGNAANNNNTDQGDYIYTTSQALTPAVIPNAPTISANGSLNLCNGASVTLSVVAQSGVTYAWFDANNQQVATGASFTTSQEGCYEVVATASGGTANSTNTICTDVILVDAGFSGLENVYCTDSGPVEIQLNTPGGILSGDGISGTTFNPQLAGPGDHIISYTVTTQEGCSDTETALVQVQQILSPEFTGLPQTICNNNNPIELVAENPGGVFSGLGVSNSVFNPDLTAGIYEVTYVTGSGLCVQSSSQQVEIFESPDPSFGGLLSEYCSNGDVTDLVPAESGGVFSGNGITNNSFNPQLAGAGNFVITYTISNTNECTSVQEQQMLVNQEVSADFEIPASSICLNNGPIELIALEAGGIFEGDGMNNNVFDPTVGIGIYSITYSNGEGSCATSTVQNIEVLTLPDATFVGLESGYCLGSDPVVLIPVAEGGTFSGNGILVDTFTPSAEFLGENFISYTITSENGCSNSTEQSVFVYETLDSQFSGLQSTYCVGDESAILIPLNEGGVFFGSGISGNEFDPSTLDPGIYVIEYAIEFVGCSSMTSDTTTVYALPELSVSGLEASYCLDDESVNLVPSQIVTIEGSGMNENSFDPGVAGEGIHTLGCTFIDENGCSASWTDDVLVIGLPDAGITLNQLVLSADQSGAQYQWINCDTNTPINNAVQQSFTPGANGNYAVSVTAAGCDVQSECVEVIVISVEETAGTLELTMYPNPANELIIVQTAKPSSIIITQMDGRVVYTDQVLRSQRSISLDGFSSGMYQVVVRNAAGKTAQMLQVSKK